MANTIDPEVIQLDSVFWPFLLYFGSVLLVVAGMLGLSHLLGERHREPATGEPYESGILSTGSSHVRFTSSFYLVAMCFLIFDLESIYIFAWAIAARDLGWPGYVAMLIFIGVLLVGLVYLWRTGALDTRIKPPLRTGKSEKG